MTEGTAVQHAVLSAYFPVVVPLRTYLERILSTPLLDTPEESEAERTILDGLIAVPDPSCLTSCMLSTVPMPTETPQDMQAMLKHVQDVLTSQRRPDLLRAAYQRASTVTLFEHSAFQHAWDRLLSRMGTQAMCHMLLSTTYFARVDPQSDAYAQLWGAPFSEWDVTRTSSMPEKEGNRPEHAVSSHTTLSATRIVLRRSRIFHARKCVRYRHGIVLGLPPTHILYAHQGPRMSKATHQQRRQRVAQVVQAIFPQAFGRPFAWHTRTSSSTYARLTSTPRWPRHMARITQLVDSMLRRHDRFRYDLALDACCPSVLRRRSRRHGSGGRTNDSVHSVCAPRKAYFFEYTTPQGRVAWFLYTVLQHVLPPAFIGSRHNRGVLRRAIYRFVHLRKYERCHVHELVQSFRTRDCAWLAHRDPAWTRARLYEWMWWLFDQWMIPLLQTSFYVTEATAFRQRVLYFRQDVWASTSEPLIDGLRTRLFEKTSIPVTASMTYAHVRFLPKETSIRPILSTPRTTSSARSRHAAWQRTLAVLSYEVAQQPHMIGAAVGSMDAVYARLVAYKQRWATRTHTPLFMVRADLRGAFDSLDHTRLIAVLRSLIPQDATYIVQQCTQLCAQHGRPRRMVVRRAWRNTDTHAPSVADFAPSLRQHAVVVDGLQYREERASDIVRRIERHLTDNLVRFGPALFRQRVGIPQGSSLSTLLCNILLAEAERMYLHIDKDEDCLLRFTDDFLYITPDLERARALYLALYRGFPAQGCVIAPEKSLVNFDMRLPTGHWVARIDAERPFPWCGMCIHPTTLACEPDTSRYPVHIGDTLTVRTAGWEAMLFRAMRMRAGLLFTDTRLTPPSQAYANLTEGFILAAAKWHVFIRAQPRAPRVPTLFHVIARAIRMVWPWIQARVRHVRTSWQPQAECRLRRDAVEWLGWFAFVHVLQPFPRHRDLITYLQAQVTSPLYAHARRQVGALALHAWPAHHERLRGLMS
ncbi:telomere maintenance protein [Malassezia pachydermatis]|uniref:Telomerase reverse transcriptase n=1 Tax=Malassezia pachydermatis TaxID=77020 RepID=A0A0M8MX46_9BASI|nr:telomerase reverse transcriptase [Malassezia pachydermatis]KOS15580.1 telomerase reverse transcriptase [Malassezia pachydermatis]